MWSFEQQCAPCSRGSLAAFGVALVDSPQWVNMGREGKGQGVGTHPGMHFNDHCCFFLPHDGCFLG